MIEKVPLEKAAEGYERMLSSKARFRVVLAMPSCGRPEHLNFSASAFALNVL